jgi:ABC transport system ATP-binding/permease protein
MWKLNIEDDQANVTTVNLVRDEYSIGRDVGNTVRLTERNISRKHAALRRSGETWVLQDLKSYNGCYVNGKRVVEEHTLGHSDLIQLGDYRLELTSDATQSTESASSTVPVRPLSQTLRELPDRLVMLAGPAVGVPFSLLHSKVVVGRGEDCDLPINDTSVSRVHAEIHTLGNGRYEIVDLGSSNGVRINGTELRRGLIEAGDVIELGDVVLKFIPAGQLFNVQEYLAAVGGRHTLEPGTGEFGPGSSSSNRVVAVAAVIAVLVVVVLALTQGTPTETSGTTSSATPQLSPAALALEEATKRLAEGDLPGAVAKAGEIPEESNLRASPAFKDIHARWASKLFEQASATSDEAEKRALLDQIASSPNVGSVERKRAASELALLDSETVDVSELPADRKGSTQGATTATGRTSSPPAPRSPAPPRSTTPSPAPAPTPTTQPNDVKGGLVRDTPF